MSIFFVLLHVKLNCWQDFVSFALNKTMIIRSKVQILEIDKIYAVQGIGHV